MTNNLTKTHVIVFAALLVLFTTLAFFITNAGVDDQPNHDTLVFLTTLSTITGPLVGAISRGFQGCCLRFSLSMMAYCAPVLLVGLAIPFVPFPTRTWVRVMRMVLWTAGWFTWFAGGILSFGHALT